MWGFQTKFNLYKELAYNFPWVGPKQKTSYYQTDLAISQHPLLGNAWTDIGHYLGQQALSGNPRAQSVITRLTGKLINISGGQVQMSFPALLAGILISGYHFPDNMPQATKHEQLNSDGTITTIDTNAKWQELTKQLKKANLDLEGHLLLELYLMGKSDQDPWTKAYLNSTLATAYLAQKHHRPAQTFLSTSAHPSAAEIQQYHQLNKWENITGYADIVSAILGALALGAGLVKGGITATRHISQLGKTISVARSGQALTKIPSMSQRLIRLNKLLHINTRHLRLHYIDHLSKVFNISVPLPELLITEPTVEQLTLQSLNQIQNMGHTYPLLSAANQTAAVKTQPLITTLPSSNRKPAPSLFKIGLKNLYARAFEIKEELSAMGHSLWNARKNVLLPFLFYVQFSSAPTALAPHTAKMLESVRVEYAMRAAMSNSSTKALVALTDIHTTPRAASLSSSMASARQGTFVSKIGANTRPTPLLPSTQFIPILPVAAYNNEQLLQIGGLFKFRPSQTNILATYQKQWHQYQLAQLAPTTMPALTVPPSTITPLSSAERSSAGTAASFAFPFLIAAGSMLPQQVAAQNTWWHSALEAMSSTPVMISASVLGSIGLAAAGNLLYQKEVLGKPVAQFLKTPYHAEQIPAYISKEENIVLYHPVWALKNLFGKNVGYLKFTTYKEQARTYQFDALMHEIDPVSINLLSIQYPKIEAVDWENIPSYLQASILANTHNLKLPHNKKPEVILHLTPVNTSGMLLKDLSAQTVESFQKTLRYQPISYEEWNQVVGLFKQLNQFGFQHTDILPNLWLQRLANGKLQLTLLDFEKHEILNRYANDTQILHSKEEQLKQFNLLGKRTILDEPQNRPYYLSQEEDLQDRLVWQVQNRRHHKIGYLKLTDMQEMQRTRQFDKLAQQITPHLDLIEIEYPRILSTGWNYLSTKLRKPLLEHGDLDYVTHNTVGPMIITSVDVSGFVPSLIPTSAAMRTRARHALRGTPIMLAEWQELISFFRYMNNHGFYHRDLTYNLWIRRLSDGTLKVTVLDFEEIDNQYPGNNDAHTLQIWQSNLRKANLLQENASQGLPSWQENMLFDNGDKR